MKLTYQLPLLSEINFYGDSLSLSYTHTHTNTKHTCLGLGVEEVALICGIACVSNFCINNNCENTLCFENGAAVTSYNCTQYYIHFAKLCSSFKLREQLNYCNVSIFILFSKTKNLNDTQL